MVLMFLEWGKVFVEMVVGWVFEVGLVFVVSDESVVFLFGLERVVMGTVLGLE